MTNGLTLHPQPLPRVHITPDDICFGSGISREAAVHVLVVGDGPLFPEDDPYASSEKVLAKKSNWNDCKVTVKGWLGRESGQALTYWHLGVTLAGLDRHMRLEHHYDKLLFSIEHERWDRVGWTMSLLCHWMLEWLVVKSEDKV